MMTQIVTLTKVPKADGAMNDGGNYNNGGTFMVNVTKMSSKMMIYAKYKPVQKHYGTQ